MKNKIIIFVAVAATLPIMAEIGSRQSRPDRIPGEYVAVLDTQRINALGDLTAKARENGVVVKEFLGKSRDLIRFQYTDSALSVRETLSRLVNLIPGAKKVEPNYLYYTLAGGSNPGGGNPVPNAPADDGLPSIVPNDPSFGQLWGMRNIAQKDSAGTAGFKGVDSAASKAWKIRTSGDRVVVAVIDTGVDYTHPDLKDNLWHGRGPNNQDIIGYNAIKNTFDPKDDNGHGTHVSGTIGAVGNNGVGVVGVAWRASIMAIKFLDSRGSGALSDAVKGIDWAREHGANIMSNSWGGGGSSDILKEAIVKASQAGIVFVAAAGNESSNNDTKASFPANYDVDNMISVASSNNKDQMSSFSNYGKKMVHIMAPGENIYSTKPGGGYQSLSGTSMATPHVSGAVALLLSQEPSLSPKAVRERLMKSSDKMQVYKDKIASSGRLNVYHMLRNEGGSSR
jgi:subtilisin family serine protease